MSPQFSTLDAWFKWLDSAKGISKQDSHEYVSGVLHATDDVIRECKELLKSMEDMTITESKYTKQISGVSVDVYDVLAAWGVTNPALQHLIKKALQCGKRGHKDKQQDLQDIIDSAVRAKELEL